MIIFISYRYLGVLFIVIFIGLFSQHLICVAITIYYSFRFCLIVKVIQFYHL
jgi:hypothetical protein